MSKNECERDSWKDDPSSESSDETKLTLLMLDIEKTSEPLSLAERGIRGSMVMSWMYLASWACLKEWSMSSNSLSSLQ